MCGELLKQAIYREGGEQEKDDVLHFRPTWKLNCQTLEIKERKKKKSHATSNDIAVFWLILVEAESHCRLVKKSIIPIEFIKSIIYIFVMN